MMYRVRKLIPLFFISLLLLTGCGIWKKYTANSQIKKAEKHLETAREAGAFRYANETFIDAFRNISIVFQLSLKII